MTDKIKKEKFILDYNTPLDYSTLMTYIDTFQKRYDFIDITYIGASLLGRGIPLIRLGSDGADSYVLYVGTHHGMEWITAAVLLRFINEYCESYRMHRRMYHLNIHNLYKSRLIYVIPMLNVDGADIQINGISTEHPLYDRLLAMNGGSVDFSRWQANARGVDLNHNYNAGFNEYKILEAQEGIFSGGPTRYSGEYPESEPETGALAAFLRYNDQIRMILTLHTQGEEIYYSSGNQVSPKSLSIGRLLSKMSGYTLAVPDGLAAYGGLTDWYIRSFNKPSFTIECGKGKNPLPLSDFLSIYSKLRELLFTAPILI